MKKRKARTFSVDHGPASVSATHSPPDLVDNAHWNHGFFHERRSCRATHEDSSDPTGGLLQGCQSFYVKNLDEIPLRRKLVQTAQMVSLSFSNRGLKYPQRASSSAPPKTFEIMQHPCEVGRFSRNATGRRRGSHKALRVHSSRGAQLAPSKTNLADGNSPNPANAWALSALCSTESTRVR